ncbi:MAG TPA: YggS family pyridoxal phosphate-dependent enzyme [Prolixibacteraceae bacterium]|nr:YggS family pyridoxal phosphate-dependent enzyme [Prolixibacteraceae bacterium]
MSIPENIEKIKNSLPAHVKLVAISKTKPNEMIEEAYKAGQRMFGENKVQELVQKYESLPKNIEWHYIGHLQSNKVKYMAPFVTLIHAVDSLKLLITIDKEALKNNRKIDCLLQFHIAEEDTKFGLSLDEAIEILDSSEFKNLANVTIVGIMGMATYTTDVEQIRREFKNLHSIFQHLKTKYFSEQLYFNELSMGMSDDYPIAVEEGSTMVRIGSTIFGHR